MFKFVKTLLAPVIAMFLVHIDFSYQDHDAYL